MCLSLFILPDWIAEVENYWPELLSPFHLFLVSLVAISGLIALTLVTHTLWLMLIRSRRQRWEDALRGRVEDEISIWLAGDYSTEELTISLREELKKNHRSERVILDVIYATSKLFRGEGQSALRELLTSLDLYNTCYKLLKSGHWEQQAYATRIISQLQIAPALPLLKRKLTTKNKTLRLELIIAMVSLGDQVWLRDVEDTHPRLSEWEQILLLERFRQMDASHLPSFDGWLSSTHADWVLFGVRLCQHYNRFDKVFKMGMLLMHDDHRVQIAVLDAFSYLSSPENVPFLTNYIYQTEGDRLVCALKVLGSQGDPDVLDLLISYTQHLDPAVQLGALSALKEVGLSKDELWQLTTESRYIDHLFDPRLA